MHCAKNGKPITVYIICRDKRRPPHNWRALFQESFSPELFQTVDSEARLSCNERLGYFFGDRGSSSMDDLEAP